jgi:hypothetical protein
VRVVVWAHDLARSFWDAVGKEGEFPRDLEAAFESAYPVTVKQIRRLTLGVVQDWLASLGIAVDAHPDRALCGCLAAARGNAVVFVDANDATDEQRYTLAHELAHFLRDVWRPRQRVERILGTTGTAVYDGDRVATPEERIAAAIEGVDLGIHVHLLPRDAAGRPATAVIADHEDCADILAFELLAPASHLTQAGADDWPTAELLDRLTHDYGLPRVEAARYAAWLRASRPKQSLWLQALRASM